VINYHSDSIPTLVDVASTFLLQGLNTRGLPMNKNYNEYETIFYNSLKLYFTNNSRNLILSKYVRELKQSIIKLKRFYDKYVLEKNSDVETALILLLPFLIADEKLYISKNSDYHKTNETLDEILKFINFIGKNQNLANYILADLNHDYKHLTFDQAKLKDVYNGWDWKNINDVDGNPIRPKIKFKKWYSNCQPLFLLIHALRKINSKKNTAGFIVDLSELFNKEINEQYLLKNMIKKTF